MSTLTDPLFTPKLWAEVLQQNFKESILGGLNIEGPDHDDMGKQFLDYLDPTLSAYLRLVDAKIILGGGLRRNAAYSVRWRDKYYSLMGGPYEAWDLQIAEILKKIQEQMSEQL